MTTSFKSPQPSPLGLVLSLARSLGLVSTVDDVVIVPLSQWHAMHERHEAERERANQNERDRRELAAALLVSEATVRRLTAELATARGQP